MTVHETGFSTDLGMGPDKKAADIQKALQAVVKALEPFPKSRQAAILQSVTILLDLK